jgi:murein DD-endopeptidase MepM/ murein hydrolase activator NlpD
MLEKHRILKPFLLGMSLICMGFASHAADIDKPDVNKQIEDFPADSLALPGYFAPIKGKVISPFGYRGRHFHSGTDIKLQHGDTVRAAFDGVVTKACRYSGYGNLVILKHPNQIETYYSHLSKCVASLGDTVKAGQVIGLGGRTGRATTDHLHFEVRFNHVAKNAEKYFDFKKCEVKEAMKDKLAYTLVVKANQPVALVVVPVETSKMPSESANSSDSTLMDDRVTIRKGDTLYSLSKRFGTTVKQLQDWNDLRGTNLQIGFHLRVR